MQRKNIHGCKFIGKLVHFLSCIGDSQHPSTVIILPSLLHLEFQVSDDDLQFWRQPIVRLLCPGNLHNEWLDACKAAANSGKQWQSLAMPWQVVPIRIWQTKTLISEKCMPWWKVFILEYIMPHALFLFSFSIFKTVVPRSHYTWLYCVVQIQHAFAYKICITVSAHSVKAGSYIHSVIEMSWILHDLLQITLWCFRLN